KPRSPRHDQRLSSPCHGEGNREAVEGLCPIRRRQPLRLAAFGGDPPPHCMGRRKMIFALATPPGRGAIAIIRVSGSGVSGALTALGAGVLKPRMASLRSLTHDGAILDQALVLWFPGPQSYTGEDCAELHLHGGRAVVEAVSAALIALGLRPAE